MVMAIEQVISEYLQQVEKSLTLFEGRFGRRDLVRAWRESIIPQEGDLAEGIEFRMHGFGCAVEFPDYDVDFDFVSLDQVGFDAWRLWLFAKQFPHRYPQYQDREAIVDALAERLDAGAITRVEANYPGEANDNLFILTGQ
jgi:hypothetical protein